MTPNGLLAFVVELQGGVLIYLSYVVRMDYGNYVLGWILLLLGLWCSLLGVVSLL